MRATDRLATAFVMTADEPVSANFTGTVDPRWKIELPSALTGCKMPDHCACTCTMNAGGVVSRTVTVNVAEALLPAASCAAHATLVIPIANVVPDAGAHTVASLPSTLSVAVAANVTAAPFGPVASAVIGPGTAI